LCNYAYREITVDKVQMEIIGLASSPQSSGSYALILQEAGGMRRLSILIGAELAQSIALELEAIKPPRPVTHDLMKSIIDALGATLLEVTINDLREGTFYAVLTFDATPQEVDARPSDAIALAIRCGAPIFVLESVMAEAGVLPQEEEEYDEDEEEYEDASETPVSQEPERPKTLREVLQGKLDDAVKKEDYERAAQIRDEIDRLERSA
jgi:bifunctional DNase/RNase